jgi:hypothetical protein
LLLSA